ncbi:MAG: hypothetical protein ACR9NN_24935 [Nostochopsis sp.]
MTESSAPTGDRLNRIEASLATHNEILTQLAPLTAQISQLLAQQTSRGDRQQETLNRHDEALIRIEGAIANLTNQMNQLGSRVDALTTSTTETLRLVADNSREIRDIWRYLRYEPRNGNGRGGAFGFCCRLWLTSSR